MPSQQLVANDNLDQARAYRLFAGLLSGALGEDNSYTQDDGNIYNPANQFQVIDPYRGTVTQGRTYNNSATLNGSAPASGINPLMAFGLLVGAWYLLKH